MKKIIIFLLVLIVVSFSVNCYADIKLWRYTDKLTGEERGLAYSENSASNPEWNSEVIPESKKKECMDLYKQQQDAKNSSYISEKDRKAKKCKNKLKDLGFDKEEIAAILGDAYGN